MKKLLLSCCCFIFTVLGLLAQEGYWKKSNPYDSLQKIPKYENFELYSLDYLLLKQKLSQSPNRSKNDSDVMIELPVLERGFQKFKIYEASNFEPGLRHLFPEINAYVAVGLTDPNTRAHISISPYGFYATIYSGNFPSITIEQFSSTSNLYIVVQEQEAISNQEISCRILELESYPLNIEERIANDGFLRTFRLAVATTSNYSEFHLQRLGIPLSASVSEKKTAVLSAVNEAVTKLNSIFERDVSVHLSLIENTPSLIFLDPATDPYTPGSPSDNIAENITTCNSLIGTENFDIGHVFSGSNLGGLAYVGAVCLDDYKAGAVSGVLEPIGDYFYFLIAHEMGHQFGANHSFNNECGGNVNRSTSIEPGSGSTIMSYAGGCTPNSATHSIGYFNAVSITEMWNNLTRGNSQCGTLTANNNAPLTASSPALRIIPKSTPFILEGTASDPGNPSGDNLTYSWEQINPQAAQMPPRNTNVDGPMFLINPPRSESHRFMPRMETIQAGATENRWEVIPSVARNMDFKFLVRNNAPGGGSTVSSSSRVKVIDGAGPFVVTSQNISETWTTHRTEVITWDVAGTTEAPINCSHVNILFSTDGGYTYPYVLSESVPNSGSATISVPGINTSKGRVMVRAHDNIFFDINDRDIIVTGELSTDDFNQEELSLYPNPGNTVTLKFLPNSGAPIEISLFDLRGRLIDKHSYEGANLRVFEKTFDYNHLEDATYFLVIKNGNTTLTKKFIKSD